ncbi:hypothetical protein GGI17_000189 [Coemansia sp. S146]|nr:hypothetical protein GGI17_000189 [Coemansia sp. S146]
MTVLPRDKLCETISKNKLDGRLYLLVKAMPPKPSFVAVVDNELSKPQAVLGRVIQGSSLSPLLFNYTIDKAPSLVHKEGLSACATRCRIGVTAIADDIATVARSPDEAQSILDVMSTFAAEQKITWAPEKCVFLAMLQLSLQIDGQRLSRKNATSNILDVSITHLGVNLNRVIGTYKAFIRPTMEYVLEICIPNASLVKALERCQGDMLRAMLGQSMEHRRRAKISSYIRRRQLDSDNKHILSGLFDMERVVQMKSSHLTPRLCQEAYCAGPPHLITTTISEK